MENSNSKCSFVEHGEINANIFCFDCKVYMCNKCEVFHSKLCKIHLTKNLENDFQEIFTGFCKEDKHCNELEYFSKITMNYVALHAYAK